MPLGPPSPSSIRSAVGIRTPGHLITWFILDFTGDPHSRKVEYENYGSSMIAD